MVTYIYISVSRVSMTRRPEYTLEPWNNLKTPSSSRRCFTTARIPIRKQIEVTAFRANDITTKHLLKMVTYLYLGVITRSGVSSSPCGRVYFISAQRSASQRCDHDHDRVAIPCQRGALWSTCILRCNHIQY